MNKESVFINSEELVEVKSQLFVLVFTKHLPEVKGKDIQMRQGSVGVGVAFMKDVPVPFSLLLHDIIPRVNSITGMFIKQIKRRPGELQYLSIIFFQFFKNALTEFRLRSLMSLVYNDQIPVDTENLIIFVKLSSDQLRPSQIL